MNQQRGQQPRRRVSSEQQARRSQAAQRRPLTPEEVAIVKARRARRAKAKRQRQIRRRITLIVCGVILLVIGCFVLFESLILCNSAKIEAGTEIYATDYLRFKKAAAEFTDAAEFNVNVPGTYKVHIKAGKIRHRVKLVVEDTVAPVLTLKQINVGCDEDVDPANFVESCEDKTEVVYSYETTPNFSELGQVNVTIVATDLGGNATKATVVADVTPIMSELTLEAGSSVPAATDFLCSRFKSSSATFVENVDSSVMNHVAQTTVKIKVDGVEYSSILSTKDTVAPKLTLKESAESYTLIETDPAILVESCDDATDITYTFEKEIKKEKLGKQKVTIIATDEAGNTDSASTYLKLVADTEAPVISGAREMIAYVGGSIAYRSFLTYSDNAGEDNLTVDIDSTGVDLSTAGEYTIKVTITDMAGNSISDEFPVTVVEQTYSEETLWEKCDVILASIITDNMTVKEKVTAIYWYVRRNLSFVNTSEKGDWIKAAVTGIDDKKGDCYVYACYTKALLTRAGIKNMDIQKIPVNDGIHGHHYWNLVDIGDGKGWYHVDTCPRRNTTEKIIMWNDADLMVFSAAHNDCYNYDHSIYTGIA